MAIDLKNANILITGGTGFLGKEVKRALLEHGCAEGAIAIASYPEFDLRRYDDCLRAVEGKEVVFHLAARVAGVREQLEKPGEFFYDNIMMGAQLIEAARVSGVKKVIFPSTIHAYPASAPLPLEEKDLWVGFPEAANAPYGLAKRVIATELLAYYAQYGLESAYCILPNLYGPLRTPAVSFFEAMLQKFMAAKRDGLRMVIFRGTGKDVREFLHVRDAAQALILAVGCETPEPLNISSGEAVTFHELASLMKEAVGFHGEVQWDGEGGGGAPRYLSGRRAKEVLGFMPSYTLREGIRELVES